MRNKLVAITILGGGYAYLNISKEEAVDRYIARMSESDRPFVSQTTGEQHSGVYSGSNPYHKREKILEEWAFEFEFDDEIQIYAEGAVNLGLPG
jgi:hypothetical protein